ncbi:MAG: class I poly(R)-hydroxyalkanoic acid synthase [Sphingomonadales bacterium 32-68-7]|nr:MAG: class I poly(R)-hydroxyalkanoic acid synthase [Sphingomonadales bacterium 32-68-7]
MSAPHDTPPETGPQAADMFTELLRIQGEAARQMLAGVMPEAVEAVPDDATLGEWGAAALKLQQMWFEFHQQQAEGLYGQTLPAPLFADPAQWMSAMQSWYQAHPLLDPQRQAKIWDEGLALWDGILAQYGLGPEGAAGASDKPVLPRTDRRFADPAWQERPVFALLHQTYLLLAERIAETVDAVEGLSPQEREQLRFATRVVLDAMSPANFPLTNPVVLERTIETHGENLAKGMERLAADLERGQLTHTDASAFTLGENIAINPKKSFVRWAVDQGLTVFMVSWRSADASLGHITWDDYVRAQIGAIDFIRERLKVPSVHAVGYCVAGTTLAATLAILARRHEQAKVASATFLTAQVDFERAGDLKLFVDDGKLEMIRRASQGGFLDGRYMAATFNLLRGGDLIWNYVVNHYLLGEDYPAFDLLYWNGDVTNLPARWHESYLRDLYRDNLLVVPDALEADGTAIDLGLIDTPVYIQAGREDHIAPPESVFRMLEHVSGPARFVLAGSGHIAGVVNPPAAHKYQYWVGSAKAATLADFVAGASEHPGSWWTDWFSWLETHDTKRVKATGRRAPQPGKKGVLEPAPGRYVALR